MEQQVSERVKELALPTRSAEAWKAEEEGFLAMIRKMNDENTALSEKCQLLEKQCLKQHELEEREKGLLSR